MNESNASQPESTQPAGASAEIETTLKQLLSLGHLWASYGLTAGKQALEASARTQQTVAQMLGDLANHLIERDPHNPPKPD